MCLCVNPRTAGSIACDNIDVDCDVQILVGEPPLQYSASRSVLAVASPVFKAQFFGSLPDKNDVIVIPDVDPRAFEILLRHVNGNEVDIRNVTTAFALLYAANKYLLTDLFRQATHYLAHSLQIHTILETFFLARFYSPYPHTSASPRGSPDRQPSAPPEKDDPESIPAIASWSAVLLSRCFEFIDNHGDEVLSLDGIEDLTADALKDIVSRETLNCREMSVFKSLERWSERECRRQCLTLIPENRRKVLGSLLYQIRYSLLSTEEFLAGPIMSNILSPEEQTFFSAVLSGSKPNNVPLEIRPYLHKMLEPRKTSISLKTDHQTKKSTGKRWFKRKSSFSKKEDIKDGDKYCTTKCWSNCCIDFLVLLFD